MLDQKAFLEKAGAACTVLAALSLASPIYAQTPNLPGSADPSRLEERYRIPQTNAAPATDVKQNQEIDTNIPNAINGFVLRDVVLAGMTAYKTGHFDDVIAEYVGREVDLNVLNHLSARLTAMYRNDGYFVSRVIIALQDVVDGRVTLSVIEGGVGRVFLDDAESLLALDKLEIVQNTVEKLDALSVLHGPTLERYILLLNDYAGVTIQLILQESSSLEDTGAVDITLKISKHTPSDIAVSFDNYGSRFVGPNQLTGSYQFGGLLNSFDSLTVQASTTLPFREAQFGALTYAIPLNEEGLRASIAANYSNSEPGLNLRDLEVEGDTTTVTAGLSYPLIRSRRENVTLGSNLLLRNSATEFLDQELIDDKIRKISAFAQYNRQGESNSRTNAALTISQGLDVFGATETGSDNLSRIEGRSDFFKAELNASHQREIAPAWYLSGAVAGQYSPHPLLTSEEFGYGGITFGRAYDPSEIIGDQGAAASLELLYTDVPLIAEWNMNLTPFVFYDIGKVWNEDAGASPTSGSSTGFGGYYSINNHYNGSLQLAFPLTKPIATPIMNGENGPRILFSLGRVF